MKSKSQVRRLRAQTEIHIDMKKFNKLCKKLPKGFGKIDDCKPEWPTMHKTKRWKPELGNAYWSVSGYRADTLYFIWYGNGTDVGLYKIGNVFKTKRQAQQAAKAVKETLLAFHRGAK